jgi:predicted alpha/beta superfamily hydrolase
MSPEVTLPGTCVFDVAPRAGSVPWRIFLAVPDAPAPATGFPLIVLLDANAGFATLTETLRRAAVRPRATGIVPTVIAGIGYPTDGLHDRERRSFDYTAGPGSEASSAERRTGGRDAFLAFILDDLLPELAGRCTLDPARRTLFGHSLAGFFTLDVLGSDGGAFANHVAVSPSIWWDELRLLAGLESAARGPAKRLALYVGEWEQTPAQQRLPESAEIAARRARRAMVDRTRAFATAAQAKLPAGSEVECTVLPDEDHASVLAVAMGRALRFVLRE